LFLPSGCFCASALLLVADPGKEGLGGMPRSAPFDASASTPRGASGLGGVPTPDAHHSYSITLLPHPSQPGSQSVCGGAAKDRRSAARSARRGRNDRRGRPPVRRTLAPPLWPGHRPLPPNHARPQAGLLRAASAGRLLYRPDAIHLTPRSWMRKRCVRTPFFHDRPFPLRNPWGFGRFSALFVLSLSYRRCASFFHFPRSDCR
jgi:hypothetical protein